MSKRKDRPTPVFSTKLPLMKTTGEPFKPDFFLVIKDGKLKAARIDPSIDFNPLIQQLEDVLNYVEELRWARMKRDTKRK